MVGSLAISAGFLLLKPKKQSENISDKQEPDEIITDDFIFRVQNNFEKYLDNTGLPDSITGKDLYIYKNLMRNWYNELTSRDRYNKDLMQQYRNDWVGYMQGLADRSSKLYFSLEADNEDSQDRYYDEHVVASKKVFAIEDAFSVSVGLEAVAELQRIRGKDNSDFNLFGELAPDGFCWDADQKLKKN